MHGGDRKVMSSHCQVKLDTQQASDFGCYGYETCSDSSVLQPRAKNQTGPQTNEILRGKACRGRGNFETELTRIHLQPPLN
jgi:hypothetical protein